MSRSPIVSGSIDSQARFESMRPPAYKKRIFQRHRDLNLEYERRIQSIERETKLIASRIIKIKSEFEGRKKVLEEAEQHHGKPILPPIVRKDGRKGKKGKDKESRSRMEKKRDNEKLQKASQGARVSKSENESATDKETSDGRQRTIDVIPEVSDVREDEVIETIARTNKGFVDTEADKDKDKDLHVSSVLTFPHNEIKESPPETLETKPTGQNVGKNQNTDSKSVDENNNATHGVTDLPEKSKGSEATENYRRIPNKRVRLKPIESPDEHWKNIDWVTHSEYTKEPLKKSQGRRTQGRRTTRTISSGSRRRKRVLLFRIEKTDGDLTYINEVKKPTELERRFFSPQRHHAQR